MQEWIERNFALERRLAHELGVQAPWRMYGQHFEAGGLDQLAQRNRVEEVDVFGVDRERAGAEHGDVETLAVGTRQDHQTARAQHPMHGSHEAGRVEQMLDHLEGASHARRGHLARGILDALLDHLDATLAASSRHLGGRLDGHHAIERARTRGERRERAEPRPDFEQRAARHLEALDISYDAIEPGLMDLLAPC